MLAPPPVPVRPASPLPPGVPTGPRNQNKYKDRDGNAPAVDGLDYGGGKEGGSRRTPSGEPEERISSSSRFAIHCPDHVANTNVLTTGKEGIRLELTICVVRSGVDTLF